MPKKSGLPIDEVMPEIRQALHSGSRLIITAEPGAGKTTRVPLALLDEPWAATGRIVMLEPRRLAARRSAEYMAMLLGETAGKTIGYSMRGERRISNATRIEVVTEGILTRMLQDDPALEGTACLLFDEFHERSIHADTGLAFALDVQTNLRPDLRIVVMSATLDVGAIGSLLGPDAAVVRSSGRSFPVETRYMRFASDKTREALAADAVRTLVKEEEEGDLLVFLPGRREIRFVESLLYERALPDHIRIHALYGEAPSSMQQSALTPAPAGMRKVILATSIAETSLTIDGVRIVIDSGRARRAEFDPRRGMSGLVTVPVSKAAADQRRGRAGRQAPGLCLRLWTEEEQVTLPEFALPEIRTIDLAPLALELSAWGDPWAEHLAFIDPPPPVHLLQARSLLQMLGALDTKGVITPHGRMMNRLPIHPRLAHMIIRSASFHDAERACTIGALLEERDLFSSKSDADVDLALRLDALDRPSKASAASVERILLQAKRLRSMLEQEPKEAKPGARHTGAAPAMDGGEGALLALAYPDRIARRKDRQGGAYYLTSNGTTAVLPKGSLLSREEFLAIADTDHRQGEAARILLAAPLSIEAIERVLSDAVTEDETTKWNETERAVVSRRIRHVGAVVLSERTIEGDPGDVMQAMLEGVRLLGIDAALPWTKETRALVQRAEWARQYSEEASAIPEMHEEALARTIDAWLRPFLSGMRRASQLQSLDLRSILESLLGYEHVRLLERLAPSHLLLPSGSRIAIDYSSDPPVLACRLQELFGQTESPSINRGRTKLLLHILSPAQRPLAVTQDLVSFWRTLYPELRTQMRARYPKHVWPDDPLSAAPTNKTKRHQARS
ncbi:MAG: ATP-dependent helicase HrpB [Acidobacteriota bacterium]